MLKFVHSLPATASTLTGCILQRHACMREGTIPNELGQLPRLKRLRLNNNDLSGRPDADGMVPILGYTRRVFVFLACTSAQYFLFI